ncbi:cdp-diacylglycerol-glycerol-3-phosphate 3 [Plasmopara halstedii]|uniref:CDP-diacylglycerol--glycerol-3-phosphate 3-phosphatidyltransferase n=1 Tax=Plasmopara halstedii TaxID=4781 RepID=A0A0P1A6K6_PLAHL|nr:cdp-diacylglycerol-glycerol-3-phosphate 3 [Plasmopara halstedii]CEG36228.1 cdp-diacylglycerol-glycerol-3-phosphate 3 [Plasmopara halstedii]|eukprot:XP_024572597.1 cdp-diacylglycerol-glycerol-3-phosphate 3 [Plasmopara halstedii]
MASQRPSTPDPNTSYEHLFQSLARHSRVFPLCSSNISLLAKPADFYRQLLHNIEHAQTRITISSLYLGTGELERNLVDALISRLQARSQLQVRIVLDYSRGQRGGLSANSVTMLTPLLQLFPNNVELFLFRVPQLSGLSAMLPPPFNEALGVSHAKVYLVDETLVLSGANLSHDYFTNRQDRYMQLMDCGQLAQFYHEFVTLVTQYSYKVKLRSSAKDQNSYKLLSPSLAHDSKEAKMTMKRDLEDMIDSNKHDQNRNKNIDSDTWAFPTLQFSPISLNHDELILSQFVRQLPRNSKLQIASGYLNFPPFLRNLLEQCEAQLDVISAAPQANGFYNARGVKGALPMAYSLIEQDFFERMLKRESKTVLREFNRPEWTFHSKGMWWAPPSVHDKCVKNFPHLTVVGSSNFGQRSYGCDLESNLVMFTRNSELQRRLQDEFDALTRDAEVVTEQLWRRHERNLHGFFSWKDGHWIRPVCRLIAAYL